MNIFDRLANRKIYFIIGGLFQYTIVIIIMKGSSCPRFFCQTKLLRSLVIRDIQLQPIRQFIVVSKLDKKYIPSPIVFTSVVKTLISIHRISPQTWKHRHRTVYVFFKGWRGPQPQHLSLWILYFSIRFYFLELNYPPHKIVLVFIYMSNRMKFIKPSPLRVVNLVVIL